MLTPKIILEMWYIIGNVLTVYMDLTKSQLLSGTSITSKSNIIRVFLSQVPTMLFRTRSILQILDS